MESQSNGITTDMSLQDDEMFRTALPIIGGAVFFGFIWLFQVKCLSLQ